MSGLKIILCRSSLFLRHLASMKMNRSVSHRVSSMTVIYFLLCQSQCSLLNYIGVHNATSHNMYCSIGSFFVALGKVITGLWQQRLTNR